MRELAQSPAPPLAPKRAPRASTHASSANDATHDATQERVRIAQGLDSKALDPKPLSSKKKHDYEDLDFQRFWKVYPALRDKARAYGAWVRFVRRTGVDVERVIAGAEAYRDDAQRDPSKTKYAEGWLSGRRWEDDLRLIRPTAHLVAATDRDAQRAEDDAAVAAILAEERSAV